MNEAIAEHGALFRVDGETIVPTELSRGPWYPGTLHGGPPAALLAWALERHDPGPASFVARLTVDLLRPVPLAPLQLEVRTSRPGQKVQWLEGALLADGVEVARASALRLRPAEGEVEAHEDDSVKVPPPPETVAPIAFGLGRDVGYWTANDLRPIGGAFGVPGPGAAWFRLLCPVVAGEETTPLQRVAAAADFGSGVGHPVSTESGGAINPDVTVTVHRDLMGEWVWLDSRGWAHDGGVGMVESIVCDRSGAVGRAVQTLLLRPFTGPPVWTTAEP